MSKCGDFNYDLIDYVNSKDLKNSKLFQAQIFSIDRKKNTAELTRMGICPFLDNVDLTAVEFFYHCEDSKGTVEDLQRGNLAFETEDIVYGIFSPRNGDIPDRLYIIGHVDIRTTRTCEEEYLLLSILDLREDRFYHIVDIKNKRVLDLTDFLDRGPTYTKPPSLPCIESASFLGWFGENFRPVEDTGIPIDLKIQKFEYKYAVQESYTPNYDSTGGIYVMKNVDHPDQGGTIDYLYRDLFWVTPHTLEYHHNEVYYSGDTCFGFNYIDNYYQTVEASIYLVIDAVSNASAFTEWAVGTGIESTSLTGSSSISIGFKYPFSNSLVDLLTSSSAYTAQVSSADPVLPAYTVPYEAMQYTITHVGTGTGTSESSGNWNNEGAGWGLNPIVVGDVHWNSNGSLDPNDMKYAVAVGRSGIFSAVKTVASIFTILDPRGVIVSYPQASSPGRGICGSQFSINFVQKCIGLGALFKDVPAIETYSRLPVGVCLASRSVAVSDAISQAGDQLDAFILARHPDELSPSYYETYRLAVCTTRRDT